MRYLLLLVVTAVASPVVLGCGPGPPTTNDAGAADSSDGGAADACRPTDETCDGVDNDCDGETDEELTKPCSEDRGVCGGATRECTGGSFSSCGAAEYGSDYEQDESTCDGLDNDCDGDTDENLTQKCPKDKGVCSGSEVECTDGSYPTCEAEDYDRSYEETESTCDGKDNDCDGTVDEWGDGRAVRIFGSSQDERIADVDVGSAGNVYVAGRAQGDFAGHTNQGETDAFVAKFDCTGDRQWIEFHGGSERDRATGVSVGDNDNIYVVGTEQESSSSGKDFVHKYNPFGTLKASLRTKFSSGTWQANAVTTAGSAVYVAGGSSDNGGYVRKFTDALDGSNSGYKQTIAETSVEALAHDSTGFVYAVGETDNDSISQYDSTQDGFAMKLDGKLNRQWTTAHPATDYAATNGVDVEGGSLHATGRAFEQMWADSYGGGGDGFLVRQSKNNGSVSSGQMFGKIGSDSGQDIVATSSGVVHVVGGTGSTLEGVSPDGDDPFVLTFDSGNTTARVAKSSGAGIELFMGAAFHDGVLYAAGSIAGEVDGQSHAGGNDAILVAFP